MSPTPEPADILAALASYRDHISRRNHATFSAMVPEIEAADPHDPDLFEYDGELEESRLTYLLDVVGGDNHDHHPPITSPSDILTHWAALAPQLALDGASVCRDAAWRDEMRGRYVRGVLRGLDERCRSSSELVSTTWEFPADLAVLLRHVDSLEGPGWYKYREECETVVFLEGWVRTAVGRPSDDQTEERFAALVKTPEEIDEGTGGELAEEYEIAGGWACGEKGNEATCYVVYSRPRENRDVDAGVNENENEEERRRWSWRYVASLGQYGMEVFEDVVQLLDWYKSYDEPREEDWDVTVEDVFSGFH